jgi:hypothetical protein
MWFWGETMLVKYVPARHHSRSVEAGVVILHSLAELIE